MSRITSSLLLGAWLHSHEEDTATTTVYKRASGDLPPSRSRQGYELKADGTLTEKGIGPTDKSVKSSGQWRLSEDQRLELIPAAGRAARVLQIQSADGTKIVIHKNAPADSQPDTDKLV